MPSNFAALRKSIETRLSSNYTTTPVAYENVAFPPPNTPWVRLTVITGTGQTRGLGASQMSVEDRGLISLQVFVPEGSGTKPSAEIVDELISIYEHTRFDGILAHTASPVPVGVNNGWHQTNITIPFRRARYV